MKKLTLLLLGVVSVIGIGLISPVMSDFAIDFPEVSQTDISMVVTMPAITILLGLCCSSILVRKYGRKNILLASLFLVTTSGAAPVILHSFQIILLCRGILGFGMGLGMPLQLTYFAEYPEKERAVLFGWSGALSGIVSAALLFLIALAKLPWRAAFLLYIFFAIVWVLCFIFIQKEEKADRSNVKLKEFCIGEKLQNKGRVKVSLDLILGYITAFFVMCQYFIVPTTISFYLEQNGLGSAREASIISSIGTITMAILGILYPYLHNRLQQWLPPSALIIGVMAFFMYAFPVNIVLLGISYCLIAALASVFPMTVNMQITKNLSKEKLAFGSALFTGTIFLGQFISPYYQSLMMKIAADNISKSYVLFAVTLAIFAIVNMIVILKREKW